MKRFDTRAAWGACVVFCLLAFVAVGLFAEPVWGDDSSPSAAPFASPSETSAAPMTIPKFDVPEWANAQIDEALVRFEAWRGDEVTVVFPLISDMHAARPDFANPCDFHDPKYHVLLARTATERFGADFFGELGDIGFDRDLTWKPSKKEDARRRLDAQETLYRDFPVPVLFSMGNHDSGRSYGEVFSEVRLTEQDYGERFNGLTEARGTTLVTGPNKDYGYYDVPEKNCRVFFLNTSDSAEVGYSDDQMKFLAEHLRLPENYCVVVLQHRCLHPTIGQWRGGFPGGLFKNQALCIKILMAFTENDKGESGPVSWNFTENKGARLVGVFSGDSHFDVQAVQFGINYVGTQGYGTVSPSNVPEEAIYTPFDRSQSLLLDVVAVKPAKGEAAIFRIGAGGHQRDRFLRFPTRSK